MKFGTFIVWFGLFIAASAVSAQTSYTVQSDPFAPVRVAKPTSHLMRDVTQQESRPRDDDKSDSPYIKGKARFLSIRRPMQLTGTNVDDALASTQEGRKHEHMPFWQGSFNYLGASFPFRMIGTNPARGSATTEIPVVVIPLQFTYPDGTVLSAAQNACGDTETPVSRILRSPLFNDFSYTVGKTFVGKTQYIDAFQRANFWHDVSEKSPDYHVLLSPTLGPLSALTPDPGAQTAPGPCVKTAGVNSGKIATVDFGVLDQQIQNFVSTLAIPANTLPVFVMYNVFGTQLGQCCILGYHSVTFSLHPYAVASYDDPHTFDQPIEDIHPLSHELGEWLDDPFARNFIPAWGNVGQEENSCSFTLEVGDPVTGTAFEVNMHGFTYHPEDLVFLPWFSRETPSSSVNGQYTFLNSFATPQTVCQP